MVKGTSADQAPYCEQLHRAEYCRSGRKMSREMPVAELQSSTAPPSRVDVRKGSASDRTVREVGSGCGAARPGPAPGASYFLDNVWILNTGNHAHRVAALLALLNFDCKDALQALCPSHGVGLGFLVPFLFSGWLLRYHMIAQFTVR